MFRRSISLSGDQTFFLWGPRQTGKTTLLRSLFPNALWIDLLKADVYRQYMANPEYLRQHLDALDSLPFIVIDEIQKVPALLDEVHWLIENRHACFALSGSSARKVRRGHANLLGGRAQRFELFGLTAHEIGSDFDLERLLNHGFLPRHYVAENPKSALRSYVADYIKEEIAAEGLVRNLPVFSRFLDIAALSDTEMVNFATIARDCGVSAPTIKAHFEILEDTLIGRWLPAYTKRPKRRVIGAPKFYFFDVGIVNHLAKRGAIIQGSELFGKAFENWVFHELSAHNAYSEIFDDLFYWRLASGIEVDFIVGDMRVAIEAKATSKIKSDHLHGLRQVKIEHEDIQQRIIVCLEPQARRTEDGILVLPARAFIDCLKSGDIF